MGDVSPDGLDKPTYSGNNVFSDCRRGTFCEWENAREEEDLLERQIPSDNYQTQQLLTSSNAYLITGAVVLDPPDRDHPPVIGC